MLFYLLSYPDASLGSAGTLQFWLQHSALLHSHLGEVRCILWSTTWFLGLLQTHAIFCCFLDRCGSMMFASGKNMAQ